jgi:hypothetical protein
MTGRMADGRKIGLNLSADFSGLTGRARENSVWFDGELHAIDPDASIDFDTADPEKPWQVRTSDGRVDLVFNPVGVHRESLNLRVIRSKFLQPVGEFTGTIQLNRGTLQIEGLPGVAENQDTLW